MTNSLSRRWLAALAATALVGAAAVASPVGASPAAASPAVMSPTVAGPTSVGAAPRLTNLAHLDFLLDTASPGAADGHSTYRLAEEPTITMPWTYADSRPGGTFARVGGGPLDPATGHYGQGAYNADDITRAAVVYLRDWKQSGSAASRTTAYELLRSVAYFQTSTGPNAGNVVLWMQSDGTFNTSPVPVELPDPSDSGPSYWLARSLWAFGEGYADFKDSDPAFASFLQQRLQLGVAALDREVLNKYGTYAIADGARVPAWLIINGADASAEAVLGLSEYSAAAPGDTASRIALAQLADGISKMGAGSSTQWPYGAILPWAESRSMWHAYASQMPAALAAASTVLKKPELLEPAVADSVGFTTELLAAGGPDNGWYPTPVDTTQIAYGADSRLQSLLAVSAAGNRPGIRQLAAIAGSWFFGANPSGKPTYDRATGVTFDGVQPDGTVNPNSGAESTIHGLLSMLALDANPDVAARALATPVTVSHDGLTVVQAESTAETTGTVVTPDSAWTGESQFGGGAYLSLLSKSTATLAIPAGSGARHLEPVTFEPNPGSASSLWTVGRVPLGIVRDGVGAQGITAVAGALLPHTLTLPIGAGATTVTVRATSGAVKLDAVIVRPLVSRLLLRGTSASTELVHSTSILPLPARVGAAGERAMVCTYDSGGRLLQTRVISGSSTILLRPGGFAVVTR
ncbi:hypothetical protein [Frigoribacterium sp. UYMn621]|uniref:hypothetical protein n=1 Tax=Frigoribacterium sp. UYMn621 TaxID=3156343 RepID=UPI0033940C63